MNLARDPLYMDGLKAGRREVLLILEAHLSTPGQSAADVYGALASYVSSQEGHKVWDYDDPDNPYDDRNIYVCECSDGGHSDGAGKCYCGGSLS